MKSFVIKYDDDNCAIIPESFAEYKVENIVTGNDKMAEIISISQRIAKSDVPVLITGESGVGKELLSELIHNSSNRKKEPFIKINCAAIPDSLKESEFFGYESGSFTGALKNGKKGLIESSQNGTLFMDEVAEMPLDMQSTLLRVMQDGVFVRVGGVKEIRSNARIICATNKNIQDLVKDGLFRSDLYFRLNVIPINIPALKERREDIPLLTLYFLSYFNSIYNSNKKVSKEVIESLKGLNWAGNVRELKNTIERLVLISLSDIISIDDLQYIEAICSKNNYVYYASQELPEYTTNKPLKDMVEEYELEIIRKSITKYGSLRKAAKALGVTPSTLSRKLSNHSS